MPPLLHTNWFAVFLRSLHQVPHFPRWTRYALIGIVAFLAHRFALQAAFFMDDHHFLESGIYTTGAGWQNPEGERWLPFLIWTTVANWTGISSVSFHALNLLLHIAIACLVYPVGRAFLERFGWFHNPQSIDHAATLGALLFACHPLGTEPVHYARCFMIGLVTLEYLIAAWCVLKLTEKFSWRYCLRLVLVLILASVTKEPGVPMILAAAVFMGLVLFPKKQLSALREIRWKSWHIAAGVGCLTMLVWLTVPWITYALSFVRYQPMVMEHSLTQGRLFWSYLQLVIFPFGLSADHYVPWSLSFADGAAVAGCIGVMILAGGVIWAATRARYRGLAILLALALIPLGLRFGYVVKELMVEYRIYPALPWIGLLMGCGLIWLREWNRYLSLGATLVILVVFTTISNERSALWTSEGNVAADVLEKYPNNLRALTLVQNEAHRNGDSLMVLDLMKRADEILLAHEEFNSRSQVRKYDSGRVYQHYAVAQQYATYAIADIRGVDAALQYADAVIAVMDRRYPGHYRDQETGAFQQGNPLVMARMNLSRVAMR